MEIGVSGKWCELRGARGDGLSELEGLLEEVEHTCALRGGQALYAVGRPLHKAFSPFTPLSQEKDLPEC